jgi:hypothetical protein
VTRSEWLAESDRLRSLAVRATGDHARALHDRADDCVRQADRAPAVELPRCWCCGDRMAPTRLATVCGVRLCRDCRQPGPIPATATESEYDADHGGHYA